MNRRSKQNKKPGKSKMKLKIPRAKITQGGAKKVMSSNKDDIRSTRKCAEKLPNNLVIGKKNKPRKR